MTDLKYDEDKMQECFERLEKLRPSIKISMEDLIRYFTEFMRDYNKITDLLEQLKKAILEKKYEKYELCQKLEDILYSEICYSSWADDDVEEIIGRGFMETANTFFNNPKETLGLDNIIASFNDIQSKITELINNDDGTKLGRLSELFEDLEECMEYKNFWDYYFINEEAEDEITKLGFRRLEVKEAKRSMQKKLLSYRNLISKHHPEVMMLWEMIRHNQNIEDNNEYDKAIMETYQQMAENQIETNVKIIEHLANLGELFTSVEDNSSETVNLQNEGNLISAASLVNDIAANSQIISELKSLKKFELLNLGISAYEALQMRKIKKQLE